MGTLNTRLPITPDAFSNLFVATIKWNPNFVEEQLTASLSSDFRWRLKDFTPPEFKTDTQMVKYWATNLPRQGSRQEGDPTFKIRFRVDANYQLFLLLQRAKRNFSGTLGPEAGHQYGNPISEIDIKVPIQGQSSSAIYKSGLGVLEYLEDATDTSDTTAGYLWIFRNVYVTEVTPPTYTTGEASVLETEVTFYFDPYTSSYPYQFLDNQDPDASFQTFQQDTTSNDSTAMQDMIRHSVAQNPPDAPATGIPGQRLPFVPAP